LRAAGAGKREIQQAKTNQIYSSVCGECVVQAQQP